MRLFSPRMNWSPRITWRSLFGLAGALLLAAMLVGPAAAEPTNPSTTLDLDVDGPSALAGPQDGPTSSRPEPVYPDGEPNIKTLQSDSEDKAVEPSGPIVIANIDKTEQRMTVFVDGVEQHSWPVSTGIGGYSTPSGTFTTSSMNKIWYSRQWDNAPMPHAVFFTKRGHAIHGTKEVKKLGGPASHGCVRLAPKNAETFFNIVKKAGLERTQVVLTGVTPGGEYKITEPERTQPAYPGYTGRYRGRYGSYEQAPPVYRKRRRLFQPRYNAPSRQYRQEPRRRGWFRAPGR